ncbi:DoxX-like family protein [Pseudoalteromonas sp. SR44-5]|uniref:DoxX-like family protein n=1 Tax=Pseudoalteromonas rhizosphaerae TaxID=2518973 RepID=A0ABW8L0F2_9GAMM|nr:MULTISPECIES: DoxX-like family protein [unclassified Pseudoalteromonas]MBB1340756.1 DoxX-like family protein [Pseudoalteromonas sp. SR45-6]MBB1365815.1 DoxX-like family protein [Pseudoalteromonas sp. SR44-5]MBB1416724.1 DoxX-like family protein [Pseudoalteromonas sp. SG44-1]MBB1420609.1 DoxX-like family protein [Pseudoalteromonas sp. SG43-7]MBB1480123.1 DoxX-like family protein [Pseudoalteromonas sp. SG41-2]
MSSVQIARYIISFSWLYHGIFPKLVHIAPLEKLITASLGFSESMSYLVTKSAGVGEVAFAILLFIYYQSKIIIVLNIIALVGLLFFVAALQPQLLVEAFNPVTTNLPIIGLSLVLLNSLKAQPNN